ncbi:MAG: AMP-binding protein [Acidobacteriales bacterium]|nr:AMP-binding protein [Terriglobales bacterium]
MTSPERISDVSKHWTENAPAAPALVEASGTWTYRQLSDAVTEAEHWLLQYGVRAGDRVMMVCENCRDFVAILFALANLNAWPVLVNARVSPREVDEIREHCGARCLVFTANISPQAAQHAKRHGAQPVQPKHVSFSISSLNHAVEPEPLDPEIGNRVAALIYTSGTTGTPKGVMLSHRNLLFVATESAKLRSLIPGDRMYGVLPMSHAVGLSVVLLGTLLSGAAVHLAPRFDPASAIALLQKDQLTVLLGVPSAFALMLEYAKLKNLNAINSASLRIISSSGAPLQLSLKNAVEKFFGLPLHNGYGVTECSPNIAQTRVDSPRTDVSVGLPLPGVSIKLAGANGATVGEGEVGELLVRGPNVMKGYYRAPEETAAAIDSEGWFNTRDLARLEGGNLFIEGRSKELIVRFGLNVYPAEVEAILNSHPAVLRSAVIGRAVGGSEGDEEILAFVQTRTDSSVTSDEISGHVALHLAPYKRPSQILFISEMPLTPTGKIAKSELLRNADLHHQNAFTPQ